jgi:D-glycero-alpha-D-manno-heptose 1-phosphate guanylyltransferase
MFNIPAVLLVGGKGTRLRSVLRSTPKPLAALGDMSFLELLVRQFQSQRYTPFGKCARDLWRTRSRVRSVTVAHGESRLNTRGKNVPLGTAGAVKLAERHLQQTSDFFVMNGDSFLDVDFNDLLQLHRDRRSLASITGLHFRDASRYGTPQIAARGKVTGVHRKNGPKRSGASQRRSLHF